MIALAAFLQKGAILSCNIIAEFLFLGKRRVARLFFTPFFLPGIRRCTLPALHKGTPAHSILKGVFKELYRTFFAFG
jgi:hypothetical protein